MDLPIYSAGKHFIRMKNTCVLLSGLLLLAISASSLQAASIDTLFHTGQESAGGVDLHYRWVDGASERDAHATNLDVFPAPFWFANGISSWISPRSTYDGFLSDAPGFTAFRTSFDLTGLIPSTALISLRVAADNDLRDVLINGKSTGISHSGFSVFSDVFAINSGFQEGVNTLDFLLTNSDGEVGNPLGLRVEIAGATANAVPEPSSWGLLAMGLTGLALAFRRKH